MKKIILKYIISLFILAPFLGLTQNSEKQIKIEFQNENVKDSIKIIGIDITFYIPDTNLSIPTEIIKYQLDSTSSIILSHNNKPLKAITITINYLCENPVLETVSGAWTKIHLYKEKGTSERTNSKFYLAFGISLDKIKSNEKILINYKTSKNRLLVQSVSIQQLK